MRIFSYVIFWLAAAFWFAIIAVFGGGKPLVLLAVVSLLVALGIAEYKGSKMS